MSRFAPSLKKISSGRAPGQGHLGLLLARLRPDCHVTLVECKSYSCDAARERIRQTELLNVCVFNGTVNDFVAAGTAFELAVGLHLCGLLTDSVLEVVATRGVAACIVPCCYGQIFGTEDHGRGGSTAPRKAPFSAAYRATLGEALPLYSEVAKGADHVVMRAGGSFDVASVGYATAQRCMRVVDSDRLLWFREQTTEVGAGVGSNTMAAALATGPMVVGALPGVEAAGETEVGAKAVWAEQQSDQSAAAVGEVVEETGVAAIDAASVRFGVALGRLDPPTCSPKNNVILIQPLLREPTPS